MHFYVSLVILKRKDWKRTNMEERRPVRKLAVVVVA